MTCFTDHLPLNDRAYLVPVNPSSVLVCWTWSAASAQALSSAAYEPELVLRLTAADDKNICAEVSVPWNAGKLYLKPPVEGRVYSALLYARKKDGSLEKRLESNQALTPVSAATSGLHSGYASVEFFQHGVEL